RETGVAVKDDAEEVPRLTLMPVVGRVDGRDGRDVRIPLAHRHLKANPSVVGDRLDRVDRVQFAARVGRVMDAAHSEAELEAEVLIVAQVLAHLHEVLTRDVERQLAAVDDHGLDRRLGLRAKQLFKDVDDLVEPAAVGTLRGGGLVHELRETVVAGGVAACGEHALTHVDESATTRAHGADLGAVGGAVVDGVAHRSRPFMSEVGVAASAAASAAAATCLRWPSIGFSLASSCTLSSALIRISGDRKS